MIGNNSCLSISIDGDDINQFTSDPDLQPWVNINERLDHILPLKIIQRFSYSVAYILSVWGSLVFLSTHL